MIEESTGDGERLQSDRQGVYAILRYDAFHGPNARPEVTITVKEIVRSQELAEAEVTRLNAINRHKNVRYWWRYTASTLKAGRHAANEGRLFNPQTLGLAEHIVPFFYPYNCIYNKDQP